MPPKTRKASAKPPMRKAKKAKKIKSNKKKNVGGGY